MPPPSSTALLTLSLLSLGIAGCQREPEVAAPTTTPAPVDDLAQVLTSTGAPRGALRDGAWKVASGVRESSVRFATASSRMPDGAWMEIVVLDLASASVMTAAGDLVPAVVPEHTTTGFKEAPRSRPHRTVYRLNPPGGFFGGELRIFVGDRFIVTARGHRLTMETIGDQAWAVVRRLEAYASRGPGER
jgi:hypothetical protein